MSNILTKLLNNNKMAKKIAFTFVTFLLSIATATAQENTVFISGTVVEKDNDRPMEYATLVLQNVDNPDEVTGGMTDSEGKVKVESKP